MTPVWLVHSQDELEKAASLERKHLFPFRQSPPRYNSSHHTMLENTDSPTSTTFKSSWNRAVCPHLLPSCLTSQQAWGHRPRQWPPSLVLAVLAQPNTQIAEPVRLPHRGSAAGPVHVPTPVCQDICVVKANQIVHLPSRGHHQVKNRWRILAMEGYLFFFPLMIQKASNSVLALALDQHILLSHGWCLHSNLNTCGWAC